MRFSQARPTVYLPKAKSHQKPVAPQISKQGAKINSISGVRGPNKTGTKQLSMAGN